MALAASVKDIETVDESLRSEYIKNEATGIYTLDVTPVEGLALEDVSALRTVVAKERALTKAANSSLKSMQTKFANVDPEEARELKTQFEELTTQFEELSAFDPKKESDKLAATKYDAQKDKLEKKVEARLIKKYETEIETSYKPVVAKYEALQTKFKKEVLNSAALKAISDEDGDTSLLLPHMLNAMKFTMDDDGDMNTFLADSSGDVMYNDKAEQLTPKEFVISLKTKFPAAFKADGLSGGGTPPNGQSNGNPADPSKMSASELVVKGLADRLNK